VIGEPVSHNDIDADAWTVMLGWLAGTITSRNGSRSNDNIEKITGRPPMTFQDLTQRSAHAWTLQAAR
jgi:hypothetical protein